MPEFRLVKRGDGTCIEIMSGEFKGVLFNFGKMEFLGEDTDGNGRMAFKYELISVPKRHIFEDAGPLEKELGQILMSIMEQHVIRPLDGEEETLDEVRDADTV